MIKETRLFCHITNQGKELFLNVSTDCFHGYCVDLKMYDGGIKASPRRVNYPQKMYVCMYIIYILYTIAHSRLFLYFDGYYISGDLRLWDIYNEVCYINILESLSALDLMCRLQHTLPNNSARCFL